MQDMLRRLKLRDKLLLLIMATSAFALLLTSGAFVFYEVLTFRDLVCSQLQRTADLVGDTSVGALSFDDASAAKENLSALSSQPEIIAARLYARGGTPLADYVRPHGDASLLPRLAPETRSVTLRDHVAMATRPVVLQGERVGSLCVLSDLGVLDARIRRYAVIVICVLFVVLIVTFGVARTLQTGISRPLVALTEVVSSVAREGSYHKRAEQTTDDELGELVAGYASLASRGGSLQLACLTKRVEAVLILTKLYAVLNVHADEAAAIRSFR